MNENFMRMLSDRMGLFVHYGIYSGIGGRYHGKTIDGFGEWIQRRAEIPIAEYIQLGKELFCPAESFARDLVRSAKAAGAKYVVMTSKHHDGFSLFKSDASDYSTYGFYGRDLCRELADACREEGLELGFYYSHTLDWYEKNAAGNNALGTNVKRYNRNFWDYPDDNIDFEQYFREKCLPQVRELLTNYGKLKLIWFDYPHDITREQCMELWNLVKELQPDCLINSRLGYGICDYNSLPDNGLPATSCKMPTECLVTLNNTWAYKIDDLCYKSSSDVIGILSRAVATGSTLLLNVGPMGDGSLTPETHVILSDLGAWIERNSEAVYGVKPNPFKAIFPWGYASEGERAIYLYVKEWRDTLSVSGISTTPTSVDLLGDDTPIAWEYKDGAVTLKTVHGASTVQVYRISFSEKPRIDNRLLIDSTRGSLPAAKKKSSIWKTAKSSYHFSKKAARVVFPLALPPSMATISLPLSFPCSKNVSIRFLKGKNNSNSFSIQIKYLFIFK